MQPTTSAFRVWPWVCCLALAVPASSANAQDIDWHSDYSTGRAVARVSDRPVILVVTRADCASCRKLTDAFADSAVSAACRGFVAIRLDATKNPRIAAALELETYPATFFAGSDGAIAHAAVGVTDAQGILAHIKRARALLATDKKVAEIAKPETSSAYGSRTPVQTPISVPSFPSLYSPTAYWSGASPSPSYGYSSGYAARPRRC